jgi:hypothetical protein
MPTPPRRTNRAPLVIAIVAVVLVVGALVVVLAQDDDDGGQSADDGSGQSTDDSAIEPSGDEGDVAATDLPPGVRADPEMPGGLAPEPDANDNLPEDVVVNFFEAADSGDCELLRESVTEDAWLEFFGAENEEAAMDRCLSEAETSSTATLDSAEFGGILLEPAEEDMLPNTALVDVVTTDGAEQHQWLILEDDLWKIY